VYRVDFISREQTSSDGNTSNYGKKRNFFILFPLHKLHELGELLKTIFERKPVVLEKCSTPPPGTYANRG